MKSTSTFILALVATLPAIAQNTQSWVSNTGDDTNDCTINHPCHTFNTAVFRTNSGGTVFALDAGEFGSFQINKNLTVDGNNVGASAFGSSFFLNAVGVIRNLTIGAIGSTNSTATIDNVSTGVVSINGGTAAIRGVKINGTTGDGIIVQDANVTISDTVIQNAGNGIHVFASANTNGAQVDIENVRVTGTSSTGVGVWAESGSGLPVRLTAKNLTVVGPQNVGVFIHGATASIRDSVVHCGAVASVNIDVQDGPTTPGVAMIERSEMSFGFVGLRADGATAVVRISDSVITNNTLGLQTFSGGQIISYRTNMVSGNVTDGTTPFSVSLK